MIARAGDDHDRTVGLDAVLVVARERGDDVDVEPGLILPATPVSASTRIAISRSPVAELGRRAEHALLQDRAAGVDVGRGDLADQLRAVAQRGLRRPAPRDSSSRPCRP